MKKVFYYTASLICVLALLASCQNIIEEEIVQNEFAVPGRIQIVSEGFESDVPTKTTVSGTSVAWIGDGTEMVAINTNAFDKAVTIEGGKAYINATPEYPLFGYYGFKNHLSYMTTTNPEISFHNTYESWYKAGRQVIALPMVAYSTTEGEKIQFYHVTAAVNVKLKNTTGSALKLSHVVVSNSTYGLSSANGYETTITLNDNAAPTVEPHTLSAAFGGTVTVNLGDKPTLPVYSTDADILEVQVPIMPIGASDLTIEVYAFKEGANASATAVAGVKSGKDNTLYHFSATASAPALARNQMMTAKIQLQNSTAHEVVDNRTITINAGGDKVRFSQGNLMYSDGIWSFHTNQYDRCFTQTVYTNVRSNYTEHGAFDLFGWGTSGYNNTANDAYATNYQPWSLSSSEVNSNNMWGYGPSVSMTDLDITGTSAQYDWGVHNPISNGGNKAGQWRTLTKDEWLYIANTRQTFPVNGVEHARYVLSFINDDTTPVLGLIFFPDNYVGGTPEGVTWGSINGSMIAGDLSTAGTCSTAGWVALEAAGCVFLPNCGYSAPDKDNNFRGAPQGPGSNKDIVFVYWSSTHKEDSGTTNYAFAFGGPAYSGYIFRDGSGFARRCGLPVRLVKDVKDM